MAPKRDFEPLPYYRWYWRDWRSSRAVQRMHHFARGLYRDLLDECWAKGCIADDPAQCAEAIDWPVRDVVKHWPAVRPMFADIGDGLLINERMEHERTDSDKLRVTRVVNGRRGGKASGEARRTKTKQTEASASDPEPNRSNLLSSSSSSSEQSKSSSGCSESSEPAPVVALALEGARTPVARGGMSSIGDVLDDPSDWRAILKRTGALKS